MADYRIYYIERMQTYFIPLPWGHAFWDSSQPMWISAEGVEWFERNNLQMSNFEPEPHYVEIVDYRPNRYSIVPGIAFHKDDANAAMLFKLSWL